MTPAETLLAAADRIRDLAAATTKPRKPEFGWGFLDEDEVQPGYPGTDVVCSQAGGTELVAEKVCWEDARWIAALSPAVAPMIETMLRWAAKVCSDAAADGWSEDRIWAEADDSMRAAIDLARAILGSGVDTQTPPETMAVAGMGSCGTCGHVQHQHGLSGGCGLCRCSQWRAEGSAVDTP